MLSLLDAVGTPVIARTGKRVGRVVDTVFAPDVARAVGFVVGRPRLLLLVDRKDRLLALDSVTVSDGALRVEGGKEAWDVRAARRLGLDWDRCVIWRGMPVRTESGSALGTVHDALFDERTGAVERIELSGGVAADVIVGVRTIGAGSFRRFDGQAIVVADQAADARLSGGAAAAGSDLARAAASSEAGRKVIRWLRAARREIQDAISDDDDEA